MIRVDTSYLPPRGETIPPLTEINNFESPDALGWRRFWRKRLDFYGAAAAWRGRWHEAKNLRVLSFHRTPTEHITSDIGKLRRLKRLHILNVAFDEFPVWILEMTWLEKLTVRGTNVKKIPDAIGNLTCLRELELGNNMLEDFTADLSNCKRLRWLSVCDNHLSTWPLPAKLPSHTSVGLAGTPFSLGTGLTTAQMPSLEEMHDHLEKRGISFSPISK